MLDEQVRFIRIEKKLSFRKAQRVKIMCWRSSVGRATDL